MCLSLKNVKFPIIICLKKIYFCVEYIIQNKKQLHICKKQLNVSHKNMNLFVFFILYDLVIPIQTVIKLESRHTHLKSYSQKRHSDRQIGEHFAILIVKWEPVCNLPKD